MTTFGILLQFWAQFLRQLVTFQNGEEQQLIIYIVVSKYVKYNENSVYLQLLQHSVDCTLDMISKEQIRYPSTKIPTNRWIIPTIAQHVTLGYKCKINSN